jgi:hypothetical protein
MNRRLFMAALLPLAAFAADKAAGTEKTLNGHINDIDSSKMTIHMHTKNEPNIVHNIVYSDATTVTLDGKPGKIQDAQNGYRIRAYGTYEGTSLKASKILLSKGGSLASR